MTATSASPKLAEALDAVLDVIDLATDGPRDYVSVTASWTEDGRLISLTHSHGDLPDEEADE